MFDIVIFSASGSSQGFGESIKLSLNKLGFMAETWKKNVFKPGDSTINCIVDRLRKCDFAIIILSKDDILVKDKRAYDAPRDNVVLELGLCIGILGLNRALYLYDRSENLKIPTDIDGITGITYRTPSSSKNINEICASIKSRMVELGPRVKIEKIPIFKPFVEVYFHRTSFPKQEALKIKHLLAKEGIQCDVKSHLAKQTPDAIFIGSCVPAQYVRMVLVNVTYKITHIFRSDYPDSEGGDSQGFKIGVGFSSTYNQQDAVPKSKPIPISEKQLQRIMSRKITNTDMQCLLHSLPVNR